MNGDKKNKLTATSTETFTETLTKEKFTEEFLQSFVVVDLGVLDYAEAWQWQLERHAQVAAGTAPQTLILVEHPPVITFGRKGNSANVLTPEADLQAQGFTLHHIERGGDVTYHGPGQLVGYPIFYVGRQVRRFLRRLEQAIINVLAEYDIPAEGSDGYAGVWVDDGLDNQAEVENAKFNAKVAAIGVAIKKHVSLHGFAFNIAPDLNHFNHIVPCGISDKRVTSLQALLARPVTIAEVKPKIVSSMASVFEMQVLDESI